VSWSNPGFEHSKRWIRAISLAQQIFLADMMEEPDSSSYCLAVLMAAPNPDRDMPLVEGEPMTDRSLLRRFRAGEEDAATRLYLRYARRLEALAKAQSGKALAARLDPEDIVQSVFRTFFRRASAGQYDVPEGEELWKLFLVISLNKIRALGAFHRAAKRDASATCSTSQGIEAPEIAARDDEQPLRMLRMVIDELLAELPEAHRKMVELRIAGHEVNDIASATGRAKRSVERVLQQFRERLAKLLDDTTDGD
jgi:RNA polymerase sigma-70 factor (ECF subfamily)